MTTTYTSPSIPPSYPSSYDQTTPSFRLSTKRAFSPSSPAEEFMVTPRDGDSLERNCGRGSIRIPSHIGKLSESTRRSVRVRENSGSRHSSPLVKLEEETDKSTSEWAEASSRRSITPSGTARPPARTKSRSSLHSTLVTTPSTSTSSTLALAQAHGITADQFEEAKQQVMRFLQTDSTPPSVLAKDPPRAKSRPTRASSRSNSFVAPPPIINGSTTNQAPRQSSPAVSLSTSSCDHYFPAQSPGPALPLSAPSSASIPQSETFESTVDSPLTSANTSEEDTVRCLRLKPSLEEIVERTGERKRREEEIRKAREMRLWAEQGQDESSSDDEGNVRLLLNDMDHHDGLDSYCHETPIVVQPPPTSYRQSLVAAPLLPSPSFSALPPSASLQPPVAVIPKRGMMERFMSDRTAPPLTLPSATEVTQLGEPIRSLSFPGNYRSASPLHPSSAELHTPAARISNFGPDAMMTSPIPSRGRSSLLFSPDVARLLRSELDELQANGSSSRTVSPSKRMEDIVVGARFPSPYERSSVYRQRDSAQSSSVKKRSREGDDQTDSVKRARWNQQADGGLLSPTPSTPSLSLRAPSFCDSSPPESDKASSVGGSRSTFFSTAAPASHPASAPDYLCHGLPSSSPASSQHSRSDYGHSHRGPRTSPGPAPSTSMFHTAPPLPPPARSVSLASVFHTIPAPVPPAFDDSTQLQTRIPMKRADTMPMMIHGPESYAKPSWSYAALIGQAIFSTETRKISLAEIYTFIMASYPYYKKEDSGWQNSIRHNLSLNECFVKTLRGTNNPGKGCLWGIAPGCEEQFADGGFTKKGVLAIPDKGRKGGKVKSPSSTPSSSNGGKESAGLAQKVFGGHNLTRTLSHSSKATSPVPSSSSLFDLDRSSQAAPSKRDTSPPTPQPSLMTGARPSLTASATKAARGFAARRGSDASITSADSLSSVDEQHAQSKPKVEGLASAYVHRPSIFAPQTSPVISLTRKLPLDLTRQALTSPAAASPPSSVYSRLDAPYRPLSYSTSQSSVQSHRALALLASPDAAGIMPIHPFDRPISQVPSHLSLAASIGGPPSHFLPAPHIFPGGGTRPRGRNGSEEKELKGAQSMLSPSSQVHTRSPVSSMRGGPRAPMSPVQANKVILSSDPEKKKAGTRSHLPAVAALADASASATFGSPPRHLRSPVSRPTQSLASLQATMSTPGYRSRPWGSPGRTSGPSPGNMADGSWGYGDPFGNQVEAELERFGSGNSPVLGSGGSGVGMPRLYWPSPGAPSANRHCAW